MFEEFSGVYLVAEITDEEKFLSLVYEMMSGVECEGMGIVILVVSEEMSELMLGIFEIDRVMIKIGGDDELDDWFLSSFARRKCKFIVGLLFGFGFDGENFDDLFGCEFVKLKCIVMLLMVLLSLFEGEEDRVSMEG